MSQCERCQGEGQVITYRGEPLWMGPTLGRARILDIAAGRHAAELRACTEPAKAMRLLLDSKSRWSSFLPTTCPDCGGTGDIREAA